MAKGFCSVRGYAVKIMSCWVSGGCCNFQVENKSEKK